MSQPITPDPIAGQDVLPALEAEREAKEAEAAKEAFKAKLKSIGFARSNIRAVPK